MVVAYLINNILLKKYKAYARIPKKAFID